MIAGPTRTFARARISMEMSVKQAQEPRSNGRGWRGGGVSTHGVNVPFVGCCFHAPSPTPPRFCKGISRVLLPAHTAHQCLSSVGWTAAATSWRNVRGTAEPFHWLRFRGFLDPRALISSRIKGKAVLSTRLSQVGLETLSLPGSS